MVGSTEKRIDRIFFCRSVFLPIRFYADLIGAKKEREGHDECQKRYVFGETFASYFNVITNSRTYCVCQ